MKKKSVTISYNTRRRALEHSFFAQQDARLLEQLKLLEEMKENKESLKKVSGIENDELLEKLVSLNIRPELLVCLEQVPLVEIAWADGHLDDKERQAMLKAAEDAGFEKGGINYSVLESWMKHRPPKELLDAWIYYTQGLCEKLSDAQRKDFRDKIMNRAMTIARASGGFLGIGNKISPEEQTLIDKLNGAFERQ